MSEFDSKARFERIFKGIGAVGYTFFLTFINRFVLIPILLSFWGAEILSNWLVVFSLCTSITMVVNGIPTHSVNVMTNNAVLKNWEGLRTVYSNAFVLNLIICIIVVIPLFLTQNSIAWKNLLGLDALSSYQIKWLFLILVTFNMLTSVLSLPSQAYRAFGMFSRGQLIGNIRLTILLISIMLAVFGGFSPIGVALLYLFSLLFDVAWLKWDLPRRCSKLKLKRNSLKIGKTAKLAKDGLLFSLLIAGPVLSQQGNILFASNRLGASAILGYILMRTLINFFSTSLYSFGRVLWPEISLLNIDKSPEAFKKLNVMLIRVSASLGCMFGAFLFFAGTDVIACWSGIDNLLSTEIIIILSFSIISRAIYGGSSISYMALSKHRRLSLIQLIGGIVIIVLTLLLSPRYGLTGVALAFTVPDILFFTIPSLFLSIKISRLPSRILIKNILTPLFVIFPLLLTLSWATYIPSVDEKWNRLLLAAILYFPIAGTLLYWFSLKRIERLEVKKIAKYLFYRKSNVYG